MGRTFSIETIGEPPAWWQAKFVRRQREIRSRAASVLRHLGGKCSPVELALYFDGYEDEELDFAFKGMVNDAVIDFVQPGVYRLKNERGS